MSPGCPGMVAQRFWPLQRWHTTMGNSPRLPKLEVTHIAAWQLKRPHGMTQASRACVGIATGSAGSQVSMVGVLESRDEHGFRPMAHELSQCPGSGPARLCQAVWNIKDAGHQPGLPSQADTWPRSRRSVVFSLYGSKQPTFLLFGRPGSRESHVSLARSCTIYQSGVCPTPRVFPKQGVSSGFDWVFQTRASACSSSAVIHSGSEA